MAVPMFGLRDALNLEAAATRGVTTAQIVTTGDRFLAAIALAAPEDSFATGWVRDTLNDNQSAKTLASEIDKAHNKTPLCRVSLKGGARSEKPRVGTLARRAQAPMNYANYRSDAVHEAERDLLAARTQPPTGDAVADAEDEQKQESAA